MGKARSSLNCGNNRMGALAQAALFLVAQHEAQLGAMGNTKICTW